MWLLGASELEQVQLNANDVLSPYIYVFYAAYIVAFIFTPIMRRIAVHYWVVDEPDGARKMHSNPVAYLGGVAVFLGWLAGLAISQYLLIHRPEPGLPSYVVVHFSIVVAACAIVLLGLWDDVLHMSPWKKIFGQVFAASCLLVNHVGSYSAWLFIHPVLMRTQHAFGWPADLSVYQTHPLVQLCSTIFVVVLVVGCCNATNLMDGLDGLCGGVTAVTAGGFLFLAVHMATESSLVNVNLDALRIVLGLALLGGVLAFVPFNFNPASIFMGDTGSMFLGFCCATLMVLFAESPPAVVQPLPTNSKWLLAALVMFSLPILDTALAFVRRWVNGRPLFSPDKFHIHHQLVARGFTVKQTVVISYGLAVFFVLLGAAIVYIRARYAVAIYLVVFGSIIVAAYKMGMVHEHVHAVIRKPLDMEDASVISSRVEPGAVIDIKDDSAPQSGDAAV
jgi:UDP-GlcNAc:undecaprenyl-phosphate/decaprenyl-phosphate GlcNAc-1-phosphate transferase